VFIQYTITRRFLLPETGNSTNSAEDRGQREWGSGGSSPLVRGFTQFVNEQNPLSDYVVADVYTTELRIWPSFFKTSEFWGGGVV
jgi:hypothetical protein